MKTLLEYILLALVAVSASYADDTLVIGGLDGVDIYDERDSYSIALALSGGGARGLSVIGILKAFEEKSIRVSAITGTSMGGIIGGLYASGYTPEQLSDNVSALSFNELFSNAPSRQTMLLTRRLDSDQHLLSVRFDGYRPVIPQALTAGQKLTTLITSLTTKANYQCGGDFSRLPIPFKTISTDIVSGHEIVLDTGSIANAMRATMAFPLAFTGLESEDQVLMDGGMVTPIPVKLVRDMADANDIVVAINTASKLMPKKDLKTPVDIANQVTSIMTADQLAEQLKAADYIIEPPIDDFVAGDFRFKDSLIELGYRCGLSAADSIIQIIDREHADTMSVTDARVSGVPENEAAIIRDRLVGAVLTKQELIRQLKSLARELSLFQIEVHLVSSASRESTFKDVSLDIRAVRNFDLHDTRFRFTGNTVFDDITLARQISDDDTLVTSKSLREGLKRIVGLYENLGYDLANIKSTRLDPATRTISIDIDEAIIDRIDIEHNRHTRDWYVRSYFTLRASELYSTREAGRGIANIYGTNLFDRVTVGVTPSDQGAIVRIGVEERKSSQLRVGWHWDDEYQSEEFVEFLNDNFGGIGLLYLLHARYSPHRQEYYGMFKADRIMRTYLTSRFQVFHRRLDRTVFVGDVEIDTRKERKTGFEFAVGQQIARFGAISASFMLEEIDYENVNTGVEREFGLRSIKLESQLENFDRLPFPGSGSRHVLQVQLAGEYLGGDEQFTRFYSSFETYIPLGRYVNYHPRVGLGISRRGLPPSEQFFLGGLHSFVGFRTHQLAGDKMFIFSNEVRIKLPLKLYLTGRYDMGEVYVSSDEMKLRNLRHGVGVSVALDSPIGPCEFGYGQVNSDIDRFYVNVGLTF